jgi:hypothetical protein
MKNTATRSDNKVLIDALRIARRGAIETAIGARDALSGIQVDPSQAWHVWLDSGKDAAIVDALTGWERSSVRRHFEEVFAAEYFDGNGAVAK